MLKIQQLGYPTLTQKAEKVKDIKDPKIQELIDEMLNTLKNNGEHSVGLAANQIGQLHRIVVIRRVDKEKSSDENPTHAPIYEVLINPEITSASEATSKYWEGCLSINSGNLFAQITRPKQVKVEFLDRNGEKKKLEAKGFFSHLIQHELDHLDGVLFTKYIKDPSEMYTSEELDKIRKS